MAGALSRATPEYKATVLRAVCGDQAANQGLVDRQTDKVYMHYYLAIEKNEAVICSIADRSGGHCVKCGDSGDKGQISHVVTYTWRQDGACHHD